MADYYIENDEIKIGVNLHGAELVSLVRKSDDKEYMWCGDSAFWGRVSPVLFPFVGKLKDQCYSYNDVTYGGIPQHGFARDSEFKLAEQLEDTLWFELYPDEKWKENYPFDFLLRIGYRLEGSKVHVMWTVRNDSSEDMHFSIGAHPAFLCPEKGSENTSKEGYLLDLHTNLTELNCGQLNDQGCLIDKTRSFPLENGRLKLTEELFDLDALIIDSKGINTVSILSPEGKEYLKVQFDTPCLGIWSPAKKNAPFVCIEPWYGRSDRESYEGTLSEREYSNSLKPGHSFNKEYVIEI